MTLTELAQIHAAEKLSLFGSLAIHENLKKDGFMQELTKVTDAQIEKANDPDYFAEFTEGAQPSNVDGIPRGTPLDSETLKAKLTQGGHAGQTPIVLDTMGNPIDLAAMQALAGETPEGTVGITGPEGVKGPSPELIPGTAAEIAEALGMPEGMVQTLGKGGKLSKKQRKAMGRLNKAAGAMLKQEQRRARGNHFMQALMARATKTPEEIRTIKAVELAKQELLSILGERQSRAFFAAKPDTPAIKFFPKPTVDANPTLMIKDDGASRTLNEIFEYYVYRNWIILAKEEGVDVPTSKELGGSEEWSEIKVPEYRAFENEEDVQKALDNYVAPITE